MLLVSPVLVRTQELVKKDLGGDYIYLESVRWSPPCFVAHTNKYVFLPEVTWLVCIFLLNELEFIFVLNLLSIFHHHRVHSFLHTVVWFYYHSRYHIGENNFIKMIFILF